MAASTGIAVSSQSPALTDDAGCVVDNLQVGNSDCGNGSDGDAATVQKEDGDGHLPSGDCEVRAGGHQLLQAENVQQEVQTEVVEIESDISAGNENLSHIGQQSVPPAGMELPPLHKDLWTHAFWEKVAPKDKKAASN